MLFPNLHEGKNWKILLRFWTSSDLPTKFGTRETCSPRTVHSSWILSNMESFLDHWSVLFTSGICPDVLMNVLEDCIIVLIRAALALFDFYLKQKKRFSVWIVSENTYSISFHWRIWSRYSEISKFKKNQTIVFLQM